MATMAELGKKVDALAAEIVYFRAQLAQGEDVHVFTKEERRSVETAMREVSRGEIASDKEIKAMYKKYGL